MIPVKQKFSIISEDIKNVFHDFRGSETGNKWCFHKNLCTINAHRKKDYYEISKFSLDGGCVTKRYRRPETIIDFINNLKDSEIDFKVMRF